MGVRKAGSRAVLSLAWGPGERSFVPRGALGLRAEGLSARAIAGGWGLLGGADVNSRALLVCPTEERVPPPPHGFTVSPWPSDVDTATGAHGGGKAQGIRYKHPA